MRLFPILLTVLAALPFLAGCGDDIAIGSTALVINEVSSMGTDFIELYNNSDSTVTIDAGKWKVSDSKPDSHSLELPAGSVPARGYLVVYPDRASLPVGAPAGSVLGNHLFALGSADEAKLFYDGKLVDNLTWTTAVGTRSRFPDGSGSWLDLSPTPGRANGNFPTLSGEALLINEISSTNVGIGDFIEIYNTTASPVVLGSGEWYVTDAGIQPIYLGSGSVPAHGYLVIFTELSNPSFGLGGSDKARLFRVVSATNFLVDEVTWAISMTNYSRNPDGGATWEANKWVNTPGSANATSLLP